MLKKKQKKSQKLNRKFLKACIWDQMRLKSLDGPLFKGDRKVVESFFEVYVLTCFILVYVIFFVAQSYVYLKAQIALLSLGERERELSYTSVPLTTCVTSKQNEKSRKINTIGFQRFCMLRIEAKGVCSFFFGLLTQSVGSGKYFHNWGFSPHFWCFYGTL